MCVCVWHECVRRGSKYFKVVSDWLTLVADLCGTIPVEHMINSEKSVNTTESANTNIFKIPFDVSFLYL